MLANTYFQTVLQCERGWCFSFGPVEWFHIPWGADLVPYGSRSVGLARVSGSGWPKYVSRRALWVNTWLGFGHLPLKTAYCRAIMPLLYKQKTDFSLKTRGRCCFLEATKWKAALWWSTRLPRRKQHSPVCRRKRTWSFRLPTGCAKAPSWDRRVQPFLATTKKVHHFQGKQQQALFFFPQAFKNNSNGELGPYVIQSIKYRLYYSN